MNNLEPLKQSQRFPQRIRVLQIIPKLGTGGAERIVLDIAKNLDPRLFEVAIASLYPYSGEPFEKEAAAAGLRVFYLTKKRGVDINIFVHVLNLFNKFRPMVVHNHLYLLYTLLPACKLFRVPVRIHTIHNMADKEVHGIRRFLHACSFRYYGFVPVSISQIVLNSVQSVYHTNNSPVIYNGIDTKLFVPSRERRQIWRSENHISAATPIFVTVARFSRPKNHSLLIEAFYEVAKANPSAILLLVGDGELRTKTEELVGRFGLTERVRFLGERTDIVDILNASDFFVLSSDYEGLPISVLEAMAIGKPIIATAVGGVPELITHDVNGILVSPGNRHGLATAMVALAEAPDRAREMGERGRQIVENKFDIKQMARQYSILYMKELESRP